MFGAVESDDERNPQGAAVDDPRDELDAGEIERHDGSPIPRAKAVGKDPALPIAQGQELLGPCRSCSGYWTREIVRGQKPRTCPVCKRDGPPQQGSAERNV